MKFGLRAWLVVWLVVMAAVVVGMGQTTNPPGVAPLTPSPGVSRYNVQADSTSLQVVWPQYFWQSNAAPALGSLLTNAEFLPVVNVSLPPFNADPTGATDSSAAVQAAVYYAATHGVENVYLPPGLLRFDSTVQLPSNVRALGSGNAANSTNHMRIYGAGIGKSYVWYTASSGAAFNYISLDSVSNLNNLDVHDFTLYGPNWAHRSDNSGTVAPTAAVGFALAGAKNGTLVNAGNIGGGYTHFHGVRMMWFNYGITCSNWVFPTIDGWSIFQENTKGDALFAHVDNWAIRDSFMAFIGKNYTTNHFGLWLLGTDPSIPTSEDSGTMGVMENVPADGRLIYGDHVNGLTVRNCSIEDPDAAIPSCFLMTNQCDVLFEKNHGVLVVPNEFIYDFENQGPSHNVRIVDPAGEALQTLGTRYYWVLWNDTYSVFFPPKVAFGGQNPQYIDEPCWQDCLYNGVWTAIPEDTVLANRQGQNLGIEIGGNANVLSVLCTQNRTKWGSISGFGYTNGSPQLMGEWPITPSTFVKVTTRSRASNVATLTCSRPHGYEVGMVFTASGIGGTGYNGTGLTVTAVSSDGLSFSFASTGSDEGATAEGNATITPPVAGAYKADVGLLSYSAGAGLNDQLNIGGLNTGGIGVDRINFFTRNGTGGAATQRGYILNDGTLNWSGYIMPAQLLVSGSSYLSADVYFRNGSTVMGHFIPSTGALVMMSFTGSGATLTNTAFTPLTQTANYTVSAGMVEATISNAGAGAAVTNTLPTSAPGMRFALNVETAQNLALKASGSDTIRSGASVSAGGGLIFASTIGNYVEVRCTTAGKWVVSAISGSWTVQ